VSREAAREGNETWTNEGFNIESLREHGLLEDDYATRHSMVRPTEGAQSGEEKRALAAPLARSRMETLAQALAVGELSFAEIFKEVRKIAFAYKDISERQKALNLLKNWLDEAQKASNAYEMSERDVVDLMAKALASIPKDKYIQVLKQCRDIRKGLIRKRNQVFDVEAIIRDEQSKKIGIISEGFADVRPDPDAATDDSGASADEQRTAEEDRGLRLPKRTDINATF
jgi:hypothetical protein